MKEHLIIQLKFTLLIIVGCVITYLLGWLTVYVATEWVIAGFRREVSELKAIIGVLGTISLGIGTIFALVVTAVMFFDDYIGNWVEIISGDRPSSDPGF